MCIRDSQREPEEQPGQQRDLPETSEVDVLIAAVTEVEPRRSGSEQLLDAEPLSRQRPDDDQQKRAEEHVDPESLPARFDAAHGRANVETGGQPGGGNPEDADLNVPCSCNRVGKPLRERDAVEAVALDAIVGP